MLVLWAGSGSQPVLVQNAAVALHREVSATKGEILERALRAELVVNQKHKMLIAMSVY